MKKKRLSGRNDHCQKAETMSNILFEYKYKDLRLYTNARTLQLIIMLWFCLLCIFF